MHGRGMKREEFLVAAVLGYVLGTAIVSLVRGFISSAAAEGVRSARRPLVSVPMPAAKDPT